MVPMLSAEDNELLTRTAAGTAMGKLFRRFWQPVLLAQELPEPDGPPMRVKVLGEDLVAFRDTDGRVGLLEPVCPHRGANLFFGRNEECGLRCAYHGWKFDVEGRCVDMPTMPPESGFRDKVRARAYPAREWGDFVWAYLGPAGRAPALPEIEFALVPPSHRFVSKKLQQCNWAQACEGAIDTAHFSFLHMPVWSAEDGVAAAVSRSSVDVQRTRWMRDDPRPEFHVVPHDVGFVAGGARKADGDDLYWRIAQYMLPNHALTPNAFPGENIHGQTWVPVTDALCWVFCYTWNPGRPLTDAERAAFRAGRSVHAQVDASWVPIRNRDNDYLVDREDQKRRTFTGIQGVSEQDAMIQDSQGFIADRTREHLGPTDLAIIEFRKRILRAARDLDVGVEPPAARNAAGYRLRGGSIVAARTLSFAETMVKRFGDPLGRVQPHSGV
jgi:phenylpropionate dioxygenase-like ring-hydroxylating dioxygenase large terminal subunit